MVWPEIRGFLATSTRDPSHILLTDTKHEPMSGKT